MTVTIVIPVYNEEATVSTLLTRVIAERIRGYTKEIIVVDDGSDDNSKFKIQKSKLKIEKQENAKIRLISLKTNQGKGAALREAFKQATGDIILIQDADLEYSPSDWGKLLAPFSNPRVDIVYGSRFLGPHLSTMYFYELGNKFVTWVTNVLYNTNITDMETGYKVFRRAVLKDIALTANRFDFEPEFTAKALKAGYQIYEVPISYFGRKFSEGKKLTWRDGVIALVTLVRIRFFS
jgi:glycosyltransferase involved in cell wall biosynthesis